MTFFAAIGRKKQLWIASWQSDQMTLYLKVSRAFVELDWKADTRPLHQCIDSIRATNPLAIPDIANTWLTCALAERDAAAAANALAARGEREFR